VIHFPPHEARGGIDLREFEIQHDVRANVRVVSVRGEFDLQHAAEANAALEQAASDRNRALVIDLTACDFIDSTGLSTIVGATRPLQNGQSNVAIASPEPSKARRILDLAGISESLPTFDTVDEAVSAAVSPG
jgi:anti-anti-sigma factor